MTIVPIPLENSKSVVEYFKKGEEVEVPRPEQCLFEECRLKQSLRKNGSYTRQVIYWGICFLVQIFRFRCRGCGKTVSCPYGWLVPYCRFSAEVIAAGVEAYAQQDCSYLDLSIELSEMELAEPEMDIREGDLVKKFVGEESSVQNEDLKGPQCRPVSSTVFRWVDFACKGIENLLMHFQKELVHEKKRGREVSTLLAESLVKNPNSYKAASLEKRSMLDRLSFAAYASGCLLGCGKQQWYRLRAYFLTKAETCNDLLASAPLRLSITQSLQLDFF